MKLYKTFTTLISFCFLFSSSLNATEIIVEAKKSHKKKKKIENTTPISTEPTPPKYLEKSFVPESKLVHQLLDGKRGIEIGGALQTPFGLNTLNVDYTDDYFTSFKMEEKRIFGKCLKVDIVSPGDDLPFKDNVWDFVLSSHVIEHFYDPVKTIKEWLRVVKPGGLVFMIVPHKERTFDRDRPRTTLQEIIQNHEYPNPPLIDHHGHYSVWITEDFIDICNYYGWPVVAVEDVDDQVGWGFMVVIQKPNDQ